MNEQYMEYMVKRKRGNKERMIKSLALALNVALFGMAFFINIFSLPGTILLILAVLMIPFNQAVILPMSDIEFEYLYLDKQLTVDKIMGKSKRKNIATYDLDKFEILCPERSDKLREYSRRTFEEHDFTGHIESEEHEPYVLIYDGKQKILLDLPVDFVKMVQNNAPRKVFLD